MREASWTTRILFTGLIISSVAEAFGSALVYWAPGEVSKDAKIQLLIDQNAALQLRLRKLESYQDAHKTYVRNTEKWEGAAKLEQAARDATTRHQRSVLGRLDKIERICRGSSTN